MLFVTSVGWLVSWLLVGWLFGWSDGRSVGRFGLLSGILQACSLSSLNFQNCCKFLSVREVVVNCLWPADGFSWRSQGRP